MKETNAEFEVTEKLSSVTSLHSTTSMWKYIQKRWQILIQYNLKWNLLRCVTTDNDIDKNTWGAEIHSLTNFQNL